METSPEMASELIGLFSRTPSPSLRLSEVSSDLEAIKAIITANNGVKRVLTDLRAELVVLEFEVKLLRQLLFKLHNRFRNDRGYKALRILEKSGTLIT